MCLSCVWWFLHKIADAPSKDMTIKTRLSSPPMNICLRRSNDSSSLMNVCLWQTNPSSSPTNICLRRSDVSLSQMNICLWQTNPSLSPTNICLLRSNVSFVANECLFRANKPFSIANKHLFATNKCSFGRDLISSGSKEDALLCNTLCSVTRTRCFVTNTPCSVGKALLSGTKKLSPLLVELQQVGVFSFRRYVPCRPLVTSTVAAVYDRRQYNTCDIAGGHRPPLQLSKLTRSINAACFAGRMAQKWAQLHYNG